MKLTKINTKDLEVPEKLRQFIADYNIYDSSSSEHAKTIYVEKDEGYFLKISAPGTLSEEAIMTSYFGNKGLSSQVIDYITLDMDYLITTKVYGLDGTTKRFLNEPEKLCDIFAISLRMLHDMDYTDCPKQHKMNDYLSKVEVNFRNGSFDRDFAINHCGEDDYKKVYSEIMHSKDMLRNDVLIHGDYCLPNIILTDNFSFSGFIDLGDGGVGDRHYDLFWGI